MKCKSIKSRKTQDISQVWPHSAYEAGQRLIDFLQKNTLVKANTLANNPRDDSTDGHHQMVNTKITLIMFFYSPKWRRSVQSVKARPGFWLWLRLWVLTTKFRLKLKKVEETSRLFRCDLNQLPYSVEVMNRFNVLDLVARMLKNYGWRLIILYSRQWPKPSQ